MHSHDSRPATLALATLLALLASCASSEGTPSTVATASTPGPDAAPSDPAPALPAAPPAAPAPAPASGTTPAGAAPSGVASPTTAAPFRFVAWGDTKVDTGTSAGQVLQALSADAHALQPAPAFTLYLGDLEETGFDRTAGLADQWLASLDGGSQNGTSAVTFVTRGNHDAIDAASTANWQSYFDFAAVARRVGATSYAELDPHLTYSFDYGNSHFVCLDAPGDFPATVTSRELQWLEQDLAGAEARGLVHAFLYWHGPIYSVGATHPLDSAQPAAAIQQLVAIAGRHPIVSAVLNGHEHLLAYKHVGPSAFPSLSVPHEFEAFTVGTGGAEFHDPVPGRGDAVLPYVPAFATVDVDGPRVTVTWRAQGNAVPQGTFTFSK